MPPLVLYALGGICLTALLIGLSVASVVDNPVGVPLQPPHRLGWTVSIVAAAAAYVVAVVLVRRSGVRTRVVVAIAITIQLVPLSGPLLFSSDVYSYWTYGRMAGLHGANPYSDFARGYPNDPPYRYVGDVLADTTSIYGPGFTALSDVHARLVGDSPRSASFAYRAAMAFAIVLLILILSRWAPRPAFAVVLFGWSPLVALHAAGGGHNDALMLLFAIPAVLLAARGRGVLAGFGWASSLAIKSATLALLPLEIVAVYRRPNGRRTAVGLVLGIAIGALATGALATALYGTAWLNVFARAQSQARQTSSISSVFLLEQHGVSYASAKALTIACLAVGYLWLLKAAVRGRARLGLAASLIAVTQSWLMPWYGFWALGFSATEEDTAAHVAAVALSLYLLRDALPRPL